MSAGRRDVLEYFERRPTGTTADVAGEFQLTIRAASRHIERLWSDALVRPCEAPARTPRVAIRWEITDRGRRRLAYYRGETGPPGGTIAVLK